MPNSEPNLVSSQINGQMEYVAFRTSSNGETVVAEGSHVYGAEWSEAQRAQQERFKQATDYARTAMDDPDMHAIYEERAAQKYMRPRAIAFLAHFKWINLLSCE